MTEDTDSTNERRLSLRLRINTPVKIEHDGGVFEATGADLNDQCMLVITDQLLDVGARLKLTCVDETGKQISVVGSVLRHHQPGGDEPAGIVITEDR